MARIAWIVGAAVAAAAALARAPATDGAEPLPEPPRAVLERPADPLYVDFPVIEEAHSDGGYWYWLKHTDGGR
jgi:hypothetical protein